MFCDGNKVSGGQNLRIGTVKGTKKKKKLKIIGSNNTSQNYQQNWFIKKILIANKKKYGWQFWLP